jgi:hypothetical protein
MGGEESEQARRLDQGGSPPGRGRNRMGTERERGRRSAEGTGRRKDGGNREDGSGTTLRHGRMVQEGSRDLPAAGDRDGIGVASASE